MKRQMGILAVILLCCTTGFSQEWHWLYPYPTPSPVQDFCFVNAATGFLITDIELFKTADSGKTWSKVEMGNMNAKKLYFLDEMHGWIFGSKTSGSSTHSYIFRTTDGGETWASYDVNSDVGYYSYYEGIYCDLCFTSDQVGWICGEDGRVKKTSDGGWTWVDKSVGNSDYDLFYIHFSDQNNGTAIGHGYYYEAGNSRYSFCLMHTTDGGENWEQRKVGIENELYGAFCAEHDNYYVVGENGLILHTSSFGKTWSIPSETGLSDLYDVTFSTPLNGWAVGSNGLKKTTDGGETWESLLLGNSYSQIKFLNQTIGWVLGYRTLLQTLDEGQTWTDLFRSFKENPTFTDVEFTSPNIGLVISSNNVFATKDGGQTWDTTRTSASDHYYDVSVIDSLTAFVIGKKSSQNFLLTTTDAGQSWNPRTIPISSTLYSLQFLDAMNGWSVGANGTILHTTNGGSTWEIQSSNTTNNLSNVFFLDQSNGWATGGSSYHTVLRTTDGGLNWILSAFSESVYAYSIFFLDDQNGWLGTSGGLYRSVDGGDKWTKITTPDYYYDYIYDIYFQNENTGWILAIYSSWSYDNSRIYKTTDGGNTWQEELYVNDELYDFSFVSQDQGWVVGNNSMIAHYGSSIPTSVQTPYGEFLPAQYRLYQNYPNPFNSSTVIEYDLPQSANVKLTVYDLLGREIKALVDQPQEAGKHRVNLDTQQLATGTYFYKIQTQDFSQSKKLIILK